MRSIVLACLLTVSVMACSREPAKEAPPSQAPAQPGFALTLQSADQLSLPEGSPIRISQGEARGLRLQGHVSAPSAQLTTEGAFVSMGGVNEAAFSGQRVRVTFNARGVDGATDFSAVYSTNGDGNSGWRQLTVGDVMDDVSFDFIVPQMRRAQDDFIGINPPSAGAVEIESIRVEVVPPAGPGAEPARAEDALRP